MPNEYFRFFQKDWLASATVTQMTLPQRGAFIQLLCYIWESDDHTIPNDKDAAATLVGWQRHRMEWILAGVDEAQIEKTVGSFDDVWNTLKEVDENRVTHPKLWKQVSKATTKDVSPNRNEAGEQRFEEFWAAYPKGRKTKKADARKRWNLIVREVDPQAIIDAAAEYAGSTLGQSKFVMGPAVFLNQRRWEDDRDSWHNPVLSETETFNQKRLSNTMTGAQQFLEIMEEKDHCSIETNSSKLLENSESKPGPKLIP